MRAGLAKACIIAKVNDIPWDLTRVLEEDCTLQLVKFTDEEGKDTFWHSSAHILGQALELHAGGELCYGPEIESGFYYDTYDLLLARSFMGCTISYSERE